MNKLRVVRIVEGTSVDGPGLRTSIYLAGCKHQCPGCHNPATWDFDAGSDMTYDEIMEVIRYNQFPVTFSGGDPMFQAEALAPFIKKIKAETGLDIWCYTGYTFEHLRKMDSPAINDVLNNIDCLVDGPFIEAQRDISLRFRGSHNQRIINLPATNKTGEIVLWDSES